MSNALPPPPSTYPTWRFQPMLVSEADFLVASFNAWAAQWNEHELDRTKDLGPEWELGSAFGDGADLPRSSVTFVINRGSNPFDRVADLADATGEHWAAIRVEGWHMWKGRGLFARDSFCRNAIDPQRIVWGGWALRKQRGRYRVGGRNV